MSHEKQPFQAHNDIAIPKSEDSAIVLGHIHGSEGMSLDEVRHRTADEHGVNPADITIFDPQSGEINKGPSKASRPTRSWGFSKWGAKWEPTGPKGGPNLN